MADEEHYEDVDLSDMVDDSEQYFDGEHQNLELADTDINTAQEQPGFEITKTEDQSPDQKKPQNQKSEVIRSTRLPMARIKNIMKMDPDVSVVSGDAVFLVTKATELFLETLARETYTYTSTNKRKIIAKKDLDLVISKVDCLCFLEGAMDF